MDGYDESGPPRGRQESLDGRMIPRKALDRELPHGQTAKSSLRPQTPETMNSVQPPQRSTPTNGEQTKLRDEMRNDGQTITHEVALPYLRVSCGYTYTVFAPVCECVGLS